MLVLPVGDTLDPGRIIGIMSRLGQSGHSLNRLWGVTVTISAFWSASLSVLPL
jgi:hypothetical protein